MRRKLTEKLARPGIRFRALTVSGWVAVSIIAVVALFAIFGPLLIGIDPNLQTVTPDKSPSWAHPFGLDSQGRDILARLAVGARWSLAIGLGATGIALVAGTVLGAIAATSRRAIDEVIMRILDVVMAFPGIALAAVLVAVFGRSLPVLIIAIGFLYIPPVTRIVRANVIEQYGEDYVAAERIIGARTPYIVARHVAINCAAPVLVFCTVLVADAIVFEASLSFIGAGVQQPYASWGSVIAEGKDLLMLGGWWATTFPGLLIFVTVVALNVLSESFSDTLAAPSARTTAPDPAAITSAAASAGTLDQPIIELPGLAASGSRLAANRRQPSTQPPVLSVNELRIWFPGRHNGVDIVNGISFDVHPGEVLGLIGESGCGKSLTTLAIMGLEPRTAEVTGEVQFAGRDLLTLSSRERRRIMGRQIAMIYQDALSSLNPAMTIKQQLGQFCRRGGTRTPEELLELVNLDPDRTLKAYPHELSGGQRQRVLIAMALSRDPQLVIADEPTTALDVTVQAQVMELLLNLQEKLGFALILVSHDLALVADIADRVVVLYGGQVAESGATFEVVGNAQHHYTRGLLSSVLSLEAGDATLTQIRGVVPSPKDFPSGCRFSDRCPAATSICHSSAPDLLPVLGDQQVACHHPHASLLQEASA
ncbi:dipeptide/oligopeptide/nickel ABC transporter permease/ATP-binding protein [Micropruina sonneratiae]|uniref:dipeptide/oligopeptide/nickel ABC transporter permease/ATP-binding protein n=1 Tax=Micropruina sonneratiae TaxID=2986940 RepID=UPI002226F4DD|nr:dipeptide/oligopeptide/nickel ABC transporter permease/ATP-binding protein [Micropruina sp. KQZ13P-5]MCW3156966.1 dipeptide/oligopeptide/nickel ABC transporter permease/ATP-binding protein [Micropruina sp. KQZ13P-5]